MLASALAVIRLGDASFLIAAAKPSIELKLEDDLLDTFSHNFQFNVSNDCAMATVPSRRWFIEIDLFNKVISSILTSEIKLAGIN